MKLRCLYWKYGGGNSFNHKDPVTGKIIIDKWNHPTEPEPTEAEIQTISDDYEIHLAGQDTKYMQYLAKIANLDYDQIDTYINNISNMAGAKVLMKRMAFALVALTNILKENRTVK